MIPLLTSLSQESQNILEDYCKDIIKKYQNEIIGDENENEKKGYALLGELFAFDISECECTAGLHI
jgi:hypothetical protein